MLHKKEREEGCVASGGGSSDQYTLKTPHTNGCDETTNKGAALALMSLTLRANRTWTTLQKNQALRLHVEQMKQLHSLN